MYYGPTSLRRDDDEETHLSVNDWLAERLEQSKPRPLYVCDGTTVLKNENSRQTRPDVPKWAPHQRIAPQDPLTCSTSIYDGLSLAPNVCLTKLVYPDLTPIRGWDFEFVRQPNDAPGQVLIKRSAMLTSGNRGHEWFYLDPAKGYAVVAIKAFTLPADAPADLEAVSRRPTYLMESFEQSPQGFWYPTIVHTASSDDDHTIRYRFEFDVDLPDSLFEVPEA